MKILLLLFLFFKTLTSSVIVHKSVEEGVLVKNKNFTINVAITNKGKGTVTDVMLHDQTFNNASAFKIVQGKNYQKIPDLPINSTYKVSFTVLPKVAGKIKSSPSVVKFTMEGVQYTAFSNYQGIYVEAYSMFLWTVFRWCMFVLVVLGVLKVNSRLKSTEKKKS
jgi:hypothetical protein